jgi:succinate dehydrogenase/fumarate reductase-like Fe-S protein
MDTYLIRLNNELSLYSHLRWGRDLIIPFSPLDGIRYRIKEWILVLSAEAQQKSQIYHRNGMTTKFSKLMQCIPCHWSILTALDTDGAGL